MSRGLLRGRDHVDLGAIAVESEGRAAIALSRGGAPKRYQHRDPNEDAALFWRGPGGWLLAVADAHEGEVAAVAALEHLDGEAARWTASEPLVGDRWRPTALAALLTANGAIRRAARAAESPDSCTTISFAVVRPDEDLLLYASMGDSHLFVAGEAGANDLGVRSTREARRALGSYFLGWGEETEGSLTDKCRIGVESLRGVDAVVLATDGISERNIGLTDPGATVARCVRMSASAPAELQPLRLARSVVESALDAQARNRAGDNVAVAALRLTAG